MKTHTYKLVFNPTIITANSFPIAPNQILKVELKALIPINTERIGEINELLIQTFADNYLISPELAESEDLSGFLSDDYVILDSEVIENFEEHLDSLESLIAGYINSELGISADVTFQV